MKPLNTCLYILVNNLAGHCGMFTDPHDHSLYKQPFCPLQSVPWPAMKKVLLGSPRSKWQWGQRQWFLRRLRSPGWRLEVNRCQWAASVGLEGKMWPAPTAHLPYEALGQEGTFQDPPILVLNLFTLPKISDASCASSHKKKALMHTHTHLEFCRQFQEFTNCLKFVYRP